MKNICHITKKDAVVVLCCFFFVFANLGAIGSGGRRRAKEAICIANLKRWGQIFKQFADDNDGNLMDEIWWVEILQPYFEDDRILLCPEAARPIVGDYIAGGRTFHAWVIDADDYGLIRGSYGLNRWASRSINGGREWEMLWRTQYVSQANSVPLLGDSSWHGSTVYLYDEPPEHPDDIFSPNYNYIKRFCMDRHNGGVNFVFLDGSVRKVGLKSLWRLHWHRDWPEDAMLPLWPDWMENFKDPE
jgi:prepilin-type processing-associated H-X9-DG protein